MSRLIDLCKKSLKINQIKESTVVIKPTLDIIPKPVVIKPTPEPVVIKQKLEVKVNADVLKKVTYHDTPLLKT